MIESFSSKLPRTLAVGTIACCLHQLRSEASLITQCAIGALATGGYLAYKGIKDLLNKEYKKASNEILLGLGLMAGGGFLVHRYVTQNSLPLSFASATQVSLADQDIPCFSEEASSLTLVSNLTDSAAWIVTQNLTFSSNHSYIEQAHLYNSTDSASVQNETVQTNSTLLPSRNRVYRKRLLTAFANLPCGNCGMFSVFHFILAILRNFEAKKYVAVEVNFSKNGLYYEPDRGENWWNYYFEPIKILQELPSYTLKFSNREYGSLVDSVEGIYGYEGRGISRSQANDLFKKYFKLKPEINEKIDRFRKEYFREYFLISVHYRGTDKACDDSQCEARKVTYEEMFFKIRELIQMKNLESFKIFVASDEEPFIQKMQMEFPGQIITANAKRSIDGKPLHFNSTSPYERGEEALTDCLLLACGNILIRTSSNLSRFSTYVNPDMEVVEVSKRWYQDNPSKNSTV